MFVALALCLVLVACSGSTRYDGPDSGSSGGSPGSGGAPLFPSMMGCRSPSEPGCETCCRQNDGGCTRSSWTGGGISDVEPWYNGNQSIGSECPSPAECGVCASCLLRNQQDLESLGCRPDCDCEMTEPGVDPCHAAGSCACYCLRLTALSEACPELPACP